MSKNKPYKSFNYYLNTIYLKLLGYSQYFVGISDKQYFKNLELVFDRNKINDPQSIFLLQYHTFEFFVTPGELGNHLHFEGDIAFSRKDSNFKHCSYLFPSYFGLVCFNHFIRAGSSESFNLSKKQLDYLIKHGTETEDGFFLFYSEIINKFHLKGKWYAGITQAEMLSLALRIFSNEFDQNLEIIIHKLAHSLILTKEQGGIRISTPEGYPWIEEYPGSKPSYVLNGFIFCVIALLEYELMFPSETINKINEQLLESLIKSLIHYKRGKYFKYSRLYPTLSNIEYQGVYVCQFKHLYLLTGNEAFRQLFEETNQNMNWQAFFNFYEISRPIIELSIEP